MSKPHDDAYEPVWLNYVEAIVITYLIDMALI